MGDGEGEGVSVGSGVGEVFLGLEGDGVGDDVLFFLEDDFFFPGEDDPFSSEEAVDEADGVPVGAGVVEVFFLCLEGEGVSSASVALGDGEDFAVCDFFFL